MVVVVVAAAAAHGAGTAYDGSGNLDSRPQFRLSLAARAKLSSLQHFLTLALSVAARCTTGGTPRRDATRGDATRRDVMRHDAT